MTMFVSRLSTLLDYYLHARKVDEFPCLRELIVCDRIKATLSEPCLRHILSIESSKEKGWLPLGELTEAIECYQRSHVGDRPKAYAIGQNPNAYKFNTQRNVPPSRPPPPRFMGQGQGTSGMNADGKRCLICSSPFHLKAKCPKAENNARQVRPSTGRINTCATRRDATRNSSSSQEHCVVERRSVKEGVHTSNNYENRDRGANGCIINDIVALFGKVSVDEKEDSCAVSNRVDIVDDQKITRSIDDDFAILP